MAKLITKNEQSISWKELAEGVKAGKIALQQGDTVELKLTTGEIVFMQAVKVSEDGKRVTFVSKDCLATEMPMNEERTNYGGWAESDLRKRLNTEVFNTLPEELKEVIATTKRRQYVDGKMDDTWLLFKTKEDAHRAIKALFEIYERRSHDYFSSVRQCKLRF